MPPADPARPRASKACVICHKKKIRCDLDAVNAASGQRCSNCIKDGYEDCIPRERKRKRYSAFSPSPPREGGARRRESNNAAAGNAPFDDGQSLGITASPPLPSIASFNAGSATSATMKDPPSVEALPNATYTESLPESHLPQIPIEPLLQRRGTNNFSPTGASYLGRSEYIGAEVPIDDEPDAPQSSITTMSERDKEVLNIQRVWDLPSRSIRESLLDGFWRRCYPWTPIVERSWIQGRPQTEVSILLLQAMLLAGSRVSSGPLASSTAEEFYKKAKTLFWMGTEKDPILNIVSVCLVNWWNPQSPEHVSIDTSGFWLRIAIGMCYQVGLHREPRETLSKRDAALRRRIWWSLVVRDSLVNAGHGRPRSVNLDLTTVNPPCLDDFDGDVAAADLFIAYVGISLIMGDLTALFLQRNKIPEQRTAIENRIYRWVNTLPDKLQLYDATPRPERTLRLYSFETRQLHVQYFTVLVILNKSQAQMPPPGASPSTAALLASSFVAGIFEEFLARDEVRYLGPIFTFYLLVNGVAQLSCYKYAGLWHLAEQDLRIIFQSQEELAKRWPSAVGSLKSMSDVREAATKRQRLNSFPENNLTDEQRQFFAPFGPDLCRQWDVLFEGGDASQPGTRDLMTAGILQDLRAPGAMFAGSSGMNGREMALDTRDNIQLASAFLGGAEGGFDQYGGIGNWLFNDWDGTMMW